MTVLQWDQVGERLYETGVDHGVLYVNEGGVYQDGVAWNGLTAVTESPSGAEATPLYADNIKYLNLISVEELGGTIEAYTYPDEFGACDGSVSPSPGIMLGQQGRRSFGLAYRTRLGNDTDGSDFGYKLHLVYGAQAAPSEKAFATINDSPEAITFSWEFSTTPVSVTDNKPTSQITIDSTKVDADALSDLEDILYGTGGTDPRLPLPDEVIDLFEGTTTEATATDPTFNAGTGVITIPVVTGVQYRRADTNAVVTGTVTIATPGDTLVITANPTPGHVLSDVSDDDWSFTRTP
jgi:hypothetical protein